MFDLSIFPLILKHTHTHTHTHTHLYVYITQMEESSLHSYIAIINFDVFFLASSEDINTFSGVKSANIIYIYIYIYIVIHRQTVSFYQNSPVWLDKIDSRSWDGILADCNANPRFCHEETSTSEGNLNAYESHLFLFTNIRLTATESSIHLKILA